MPNFGIITISHKRPEILRLWCASIKRLRAECGWFPVMVVGDEDHRSICNEYDIWHWGRPNYPIEDKWNCAVDVMMCDDNLRGYIMISGSDNIISTNLLMNMKSIMGEGYDMIGIKKIWFYCAEGLYKGRSRGIEQTYPMGVCKAIHRRVIGQAGTLWTGTKGWGMDADCQKNIAPYVKTTTIADGIVFDIKTSESLNKYTIVQKKATNEKSWPFPVESNLIWDIMGEEEKQILKDYESKK